MLIAALCLTTLPAPAQQKKSARQESTTQQQKKKSSKPSASEQKKTSSTDKKKTFSKQTTTGEKSSNKQTTSEKKKSSNRSASEKKNSSKQGSTKKKSSSKQANTEKKNSSKQTNTEKKSSSRPSDADRKEPSEKKSSDKQSVSKQSSTRRTAKGRTPSTRKRTADATVKDENHESEKTSGTKRATTKKSSSRARRSTSDNPSSIKRAAPKDSKSKALQQDNDDSSSKAQQQETSRTRKHSHKKSTTRSTQKNTTSHNTGRGNVPVGALLYNSNGYGVSDASRAAYYRVLTTDDDGRNVLCDYYMDGQLKAEKHYLRVDRRNDARTVLHGRTRTFYKNGRIESVMNYDHGKASGRAISFYSEGGVGMKLNYKNGLLDGTTCTYTPRGMLEHTEQWSHGSRQQETDGGHDPYIDARTGIDPLVAECTREEVSLRSTARSREQAKQEPAKKEVKQREENGEQYQQQTYRQPTEEEDIAAAEEEIRRAIAAEKAIQAEEKRTGKARVALKRQKAGRYKPQEIVYGQPRAAVSPAQKPTATASPATMKVQPTAGKIQQKESLSPIAKEKRDAMIASIPETKAAPTPTASAPAQTEVAETEDEKPQAAVGEDAFFFATLYALVSQQVSQPLSFYNQQATAFGVSQRTILPIANNKQEVCYARDMHYNKDTGRDETTGNSPRQISFVCTVDARGFYTLQGINIYTNDAVEYRRLMEEARTTGLQPMGGDADESNAVFSAGNGKPVATFTHLPSAYAGMYHVSIAI